MTKTFGIKDAVSGKSLDMAPTDYAHAKRILDSIRHYEGTDYYITELDF